MSRELETAVRAVRLSGELLLTASRDAAVLAAKHDPSSQTDSRKGFVTAMDRRCESLILEELRASFPDDGCLGEEQVSRGLDRDRVWVIDPIDGTISFAAGLDGYATSVGLLVKGEPVLGVVLLPRHGELFVAERGAGAFLNGERIRVSVASRLEEAILSLDHRLLRLDDMQSRTHSLVKSMRRLRVSESCSHELCLAACGRIDAVVRTLQPTYDYVMGQVIVEEAGGAVRGFAGERVVPTLDRERNRNLIAGGPTLVEALGKRLT